MYMTLLLVSSYVPLALWGCTGADRTPGAVPGAVYDEAGNLIYQPPDENTGYGANETPGHAPDHPDDQVISGATIPANSPAPAKNPAETDPAAPRHPVRLGQADTAPIPTEAPHLAAAVAPLMAEAGDHLAAGRPDLALAPAERAVRIHPGSPYVWHLLARIHHAAGEDAQAGQMARKSLLLCGRDTGLRADNWRLLADIHDRAGNPDAAARAREKAASLGAAAGRAG